MPVQRKAHAHSLERHHVRELVCSYRPARDVDGRIIRVSSLALSTSHAAAHILGSLLTSQTVEVFGVACLSVKHRLLAWHVLSRGTRESTPVSCPDVFVPACVTPGTVCLIVVHNHPSGDPTPSADDAALTARLSTAADVLGLCLLDHLIVAGDAFYSFHDAGLLGATPAPWTRSTADRLHPTATRSLAAPTE